MKFCGIKTLNSMFGKTHLLTAFSNMAGTLRLLLPCVVAFPFFRTVVFVKTKISKKSALAVHNFFRDNQHQSTGSSRFCARLELPVG